MLNPPWCVRTFEQTGSCGSSTAETQKQVCCLSACSQEGVPLKITKWRDPSGRQVTHAAPAWPYQSSLRAETSRSQGQASRPRTCRRRRAAQSWLRLCCFSLCLTEREPWTPTVWPPTEPSSTRRWTLTSSSLPSRRLRTTPQSTPAPPRWMDRGERQKHYSSALLLPLPPAVKINCRVFPQSWVDS